MSPGSGSNERIFFTRQTKNKHNQWETREDLWEKIRERGGNEKRKRWGIRKTSVQYNMKSEKPLLMDTTLKKEVGVYKDADYGVSNNHKWLYILTPSVCFYVYVFLVYVFIYVYIMQEPNLLSIFSSISFTITKITWC